MIVGLDSPAEAITHGSADGPAHSEVGALLGNRPDSDGTWSYCTGTLVSPTVLVTAAHCGDPGQQTARVSFASHYRRGDPVYTGRYIADPRYSDKADRYDIAVVVFDTPVPGAMPARLPGANTLDHLRENGDLDTARFTPVGYGSLDPVKAKHGWRFKYTDTRNRTSMSFADLTHPWLQLSTNPYRGDGGTCYGDSGGPVFLEGAGGGDLLVATTISGDGEGCQDDSYAYRLDTSVARSFLGRFVALP
ncbi:trypsin-like serine protease [Microbispora sp. RL4-1S]|uniref:Trypsin-like serine protease n=1 Tax=Microbispora oryzae TaxID=2806554 RepID=A0A941AM07_9ACTN|nr:trypsin-like serine protease [Microbispora oryzae]MBP2708656.1 trypsin-like serine protease [Microbispora oryzae]